jgi:hypothetical protein
MSLQQERSAVAPAGRESETLAPAECAASPIAARRGRRPSHAERWTKVTVVMMDRQIVFLDRLVADIRATNGASISRAHLIRALVDALAESDLDLTSSRSEKDLTRAVAARFRRAA